MRMEILTLILMAPFYVMSQTSFDFKGDEKDFGWVECGGANENCGITTEGYEINWDAFKTPKMKHNSANIDANETPVLAITVRIRSNTINTLSVAHVNGEISDEIIYKTESGLSSGIKAKTYYYNLSNKGWKNYTQDGDHDYIEIGFQENYGTNVRNPSEYGDLVIEKIEFLKELPSNMAYLNSIGHFSNSKDWKSNDIDPNISDANY